MVQRRRATEEAGSRGWNLEWARNLEVQGSGRRGWVRLPSPVINRPHCGSEPGMATAKNRKSAPPLTSGRPLLQQLQVLQVQVLGANGRGEVCTSESNEEVWCPVSHQFRCPAAVLHSSRPALSTVDGTFRAPSSLVDGPQSRGRCVCLAEGSRVVRPGTNEHGIRQLSHILVFSTSSSTPVAARGRPCLRH